MVVDSDVQQPEITGFRIVLHNFEGPFDLLLQLISAQKLDVTDVALAQVTDEFVGYVKQLGVSVPEQAVRILDMFRLVGPDRWLGFEALTRDCGVSLEVVGRFLALLELYKAQVVVFEQVESLGELKVAWTGVDVDPMVVLAGRWE